MITDFPAKKPYNPGGYKTFLFIPFQWVAAYPMISNSQVLVPLSLITGASWLNGYATMESLDYTETPNKDVNGVYYNTSITGFVPGDKQELIDTVRMMQNLRFLVITVDTLGQWRLVGTPVAPLDFSATFTSGKLRADQKGFNFTFTGQQTFPAPVYPVV